MAFRGYKDDAGEFSRLRSLNLSKLLSWDLTEDDLNKQGVHPEFGTVDLRSMLSTWVAHDLGHIGQVGRVLAKNYKEESGPWKKYLRVLQS